MKGTLYVVSTPIGNLKDITIRGVETLTQVDFVVAEHRPRALKLLSHLGIRKPIIAVSSYTEERRARGIVERLSQGESAALISGAGTPCLSDPGAALIRACEASGVEVRSVPGPSVITAAMTLAVMPTDRFLFYGFLPQKRGKKRRLLESLLAYPFVLVLFESPRRLKETLSVIMELAGDRQVSVAREITKVHEETLRGTPKELLDRLPADLKGECTILVAPPGPE